jgi:fluoroacetyl-CoA thioesterase
MHTPPRVGATAETRFTVAAEHTIDFAAPGLPPVLSTPSLVWFLEHAALEAARPALEAGEITVGTHVAVDHLAPTPIGKEVVCRARVVHVEGPVISFQLEATDETETIARGYHKRRVVNLAKFARRVEQKQA